MFNVTIIRTMSSSQRLAKGKLFAAAYFFMVRVWRFLCLLQKKSLCMLTSAHCFLLIWSTMKTAGSCILDTDGLDNELSVWRCQKSFGSLINHSGSNIITPKASLSKKKKKKSCSWHNEDLLWRRVLWILKGWSFNLSVESVLSLWENNICSDNAQSGEEPVAHG